MARLLSVTTEAPPHVVGGEELESMLSAALSPQARPGLHRRLRGVGVESRRAAIAPAHLLSLRGLEERNAAFERVGLDLGARAAQKALTAARIDAKTVGTIIAATSTGNLVPSLASRLVERLGLAADVLCVPLTGLGCGGGLRALTLASRLVAHDGKPALVVCTELPSLWLQLDEPSTEDVYGYLTFGDGAAAAVIGGAGGSGPEVLAGGQVQWPDSMAARGACLTGSGWRHTSTPALPRALAAHLGSSVTASLAAQGLRWGDVAFCMVNPLDPRLLDSAQRQLGITERETAAPRKVWREHGNMLSAGILFALAAHVETTRPSEGDVGLLVALGPGITCDATMLRWQGELNVG